MKVEISCDSVEELERINLIFGDESKRKGMDIHVVCEKPDVEDIREILMQSGSKIGSVHFVKRTDGSLRKMCYRLHVSNPKYGKKPSGENRIRTPSRRVVDSKNDQMTVYDVNKVLRDRKGCVLRDPETNQMCRGAYRTIPLENVKRICVNNITYEFE